ncbi:MAG TPA: copper homeostasis protein CutC, partial [Ferruginibacter sp.]|nr:copper homeostasis protein CutC [Ferruginibacter sp.]
VMDGSGLIAELIRKADDRIIIMPGSGLKSGNVAALATQTGATEFHTSARKDMGSRMEYTNAAMQENLRSVSVDEEEIKKIINNLREL